MTEPSSTGLTEDGSDSSIASSPNENQPINHPSQGSDRQHGISSLFLLVSVAAATAATLGYDVGIMAAAIQPLEAQMQLTGLQKEVAMGSLNFVAAFGAFLGGHVADTYGRKRTISLCCWLFIIGTCLMAVLALLSRLPESPRWLMLANRKQEAEQVLHHLGNPTVDTQKILQDMQQEIDREQHTKPPRFSKGQQYAIQLGFWQQITGTEAVLYYSADFLKRAGLQSPLFRLAGNVLVGICKLVPECITMSYIDTAGRRPLLFGSALALFLSTLSLSIAFSGQATPTVLVLLLCAVMASFSAGLGPFTFLSASENLAMSERAVGITYCTAANRITSGTVAMTAVTLSSLLGDAGVFGLYAGAGFLSLFFYWFVPETAGISLEELAARNSSSSRHEDRTNGVEIPDTNFQVFEGQMA